MFLTFRAFFSLMKDSGGSVVNVSSVQAVGALPNSVAYVTSRHPIAGLTRALAIDNAVDNIRVNCVCPGAVDTPMLRSSMKNSEGLASLLQEIAHLHAVGRIARPEEVAKVIAFLCSDDASFITGGVHLVDGGMTALVAGKPPAKPEEWGYVNEFASQIHQFGRGTCFVSTRVIADFSRADGRQPQTNDKDKFVDRGKREILRQSVKIGVALGESTTAGGTATTPRTHVGEQAGRPDQ